MKIKEWFSVRSERLPCLALGACLSIYIILDWVAASSGGFALLAKLVPVLEIHYLLYLASLLVLVYVGGFLLFSKKFLYFSIYGLAMTAFYFFTLAEFDRTVERGKRESLNALRVMLENPGRENIWIVDPAFKPTLSPIREQDGVSATFTSSSPTQHTYRYIVSKGTAPQFQVNVLLLTNENRFVVERVK